MRIPGYLAQVAAATVLLVSGACALHPAAPPSPPGSALGPAPGSYRILSKDGKVRIPFEIFRDDIRMKAEIDGHPLRMLIDNGSLWDQLLFFGSRRIDALHLDYGEPIQVGGAGEGKPALADTASDVSIRFHDIEFYGQPAIITRADSGLTEMWEGSDGQVSAAFFKNFVVEINFDDSVILLHDPATFEYRGPGREISMEPAPHSSYLMPATVETEDGKQADIKLMIDLGGVQPIELGTGGKTGITRPDNALAMVLGAGVQGEYRGYLGRVASVQLAGYSVPNVLAGFVERGDASGSYDDHIIGFPLLSRFNLIFDYRRGKLILEPNRRFRLPFEYDMTGMSLKQDPDGAFRVTRVLKGSPAEKAGVRAGDRILEVNGQSAEELKPWDLAPLFRREGTTVWVEVAREGGSRKLPLALRRLI